jgi:ABC-type lipoprotein export system ATPase subunit
VIASRPSLLRLADLTVCHGERALFFNLNHEVGPEVRCLGLVGASGSGKTTLLHLLGGLSSPTLGQLEVLGQQVPRTAAALARYRQRTALVLQSGNLLGAQTLEENAALPLLIRGVEFKFALGRARWALGQVGLDGLERRRPDQVSGGEAQRAAVARALVSEARLILADEPTASLDTASAGKVFAALKLAAARPGCAVVIASHSPGVYGVCDRVLTLTESSLLEAKPEAAAIPESFPSRPQAHPLVANALADPAKPWRAR